MAVQTYEETMRSVNVTREEKLVATFFRNGGIGLSIGMSALITALVFGTDDLIEQIIAVPNDGRGESDPPQYEISVPRLAAAIDAYRLDD